MELAANNLFRYLSVREREGWRDILKDFTFEPHEYRETDFPIYFRLIYRYLYSYIQEHYPDSVIRVHVTLFFSVPDTSNATLGEHFSGFLCWLESDFVNN